MITTVSEPMQMYDVRHPIPGSSAEVGQIIALDCEMVQCENEIGAYVQMLARLSVVNYNGHVLWDQVYKPRFRVVNYITKISGITPQMLKTAPVYNDFEKEKVRVLLQGKTIVGHTLKSDFEALELPMETYELRDLAHIEFLKLDEGFALKKLCFQYLGQRIQGGQHSSVIDARVALFIYRKFRNEINFLYKQAKWS